MKIVTSERTLYRVLILGFLAATWLIGIILARSEFSRGRALAAADPPSSEADAVVDRPVFECRRAQGPIFIDGRADEAAWKNAVVIDNFNAGWLKRPAMSPTRARLLWDDQGLYFAAEMDDIDLYADITQQDGMCWLNDVFELFFKPAFDKPGYYEFQVNAAGTKLDMYLPSRGAGGYERFKGADTFQWRTAVALRGSLNHWQDQDDGWSVEGLIPWDDFRQSGGRPQPGDGWLFALCRYDYSVAHETPDLSSCAPLTEANFHRYEDYGLLRFVKAP